MLKLSGEVLIGKQDYGIDPDKVISIANDITQVHEKGKEICIVVGGGNIFRGISGAAQGIDRVTADGMGMLATVINALALQNAIEKNGISTRVLSAIPMQTICESIIKTRDASVIKRTIFSRNIKEIIKRKIAILQVRLLRYFLSSEFLYILNFALCSATKV